MLSKLSLVKDTAGGTLLDYLVKVARKKYPHEVVPNSCFLCLN